MTTKCIFTIEISINFPSLKNKNSDHRKSGHNTFYLYIKNSSFLVICCWKYVLILIIVKITEL